MLASGQSRPVDLVSLWTSIRYRFDILREVRGKKKNFVYSKIMMWYVTRCLVRSLFKGRDRSGTAFGRQTMFAMSQPGEVARHAG